MVKVPSSFSKKSSDGKSPKICLKKIPKKTNFSEYSNTSLNLTTEQVLHLIKILYNFLCCPVATKSTEFRQDLAHRLFDLTRNSPELAKASSESVVTNSLPRVFIDAITQCLICLLNSDQILINQIGSRIVAELRLLKKKTPQNLAQHNQEIRFLQQLQDLM